MFRVKKRFLIEHWFHLLGCLLTLLIIFLKSLGSCDIADHHEDPRYLKHCETRIEEDQLLVSCRFYSKWHEDFTESLVQRGEETVTYDIEMIAQKTPVASTPSPGIPLYLHKMKIIKWAPAEEVNVNDRDDLRVSNTYFLKLSHVRASYVDIEFKEQKEFATAFKKLAPTNDWKILLLDVKDKTDAKQDVIKALIKEYHLDKAEISVLAVSFYEFITEFTDTRLFILKDLNVKNLTVFDSRFRLLNSSHFSGNAFTNVQYLGFPWCDINQIEVNTFASSNFLSLQHLNLKDNKLVTIPDDVFFLRSLQILDLSNNVKLTLSTPQKFLNFMPNNNNISTLILSGTSLNFEKDFYFSSLFPRLKILEIAGCSITNLTENILQFSSNLERLDVSNNRLSYLDKDIFKNFTFLTFLNVSNNGLQTLEFISGVRSLKEVYINSNKIVLLHPQIFNAATSQLKILSLRENQIQPWTKRLIENRENDHKIALEQLILSKNNITYISKEMLADFRLIKAVEISENPYDCSKCELLNLLEFLKLIPSIDDAIVSNNSKNASSSGYLCAYPPKYKDESVLGVALDFCIVKLFDWVFKVVIPLICCLFLSALITFLSYYFRWYLRYLCFLCRAKVHAYQNKEVELRRSYVFDAFISYSSEDIRWIRDEFLPRIEDEAKFRLCLHDRNFLPGEEITSNIIQSIANSRKVLVILTESYVKSKWCMMELHLSQHRLYEERRHALIVVKLSDLPENAMSKTIRYLMKTRTYLEWSEDPAAKHYFWLKLIKNLEAPTRSVPA